MEKRNWERLAGLAGIVLVGFFVAGIFAGGSPPSPSDANEAVKSYLVDRRDALIFQGWLFAVGAMLIVWWSAAVRSALRRSEDAEGHLANVFFGAGLATAAVLVVVVALQTGLIYKAVGDVDAGVVRAIYDVCVMGPTFGGVFLALAALAFAALTLTESIYPVWSAWLGVLAAAGNLAQTLTIFRTDGAFSSEGAFAFVGFGTAMLWILAVSIVMLRAQDEAAAAA